MRKMGKLRPDRGEKFPEMFLIRIVAIEVEGGESHRSYDCCFKRTSLRTANYVWKLEQENLFHFISLEAQKTTDPD